MGEEERRAKRILNLELPFDFAQGKLISVKRKKGEKRKGKVKRDKGN